jgi:hypothetical protein
MRRLLVIAAVAAAGTTTASARADGGWIPDSHRSRAGTTIGLWSNSGTTYPGAVMPIIHFGSIRLPWDDESAAQLDLEIPTALWADGPDEDSRAGMGNPTFTIRDAPIWGPVAFWIGARISAPASAKDDRPYQLSDIAAEMAMAGYDAHFWHPEFFPWGLGFGLDIQLAPPVAIFGEAEATTLWPIDEKNDPTVPDDDIDLGSRQRPELHLQNRLGMELRHPTWGFGGGFAFQTVWRPTHPNPNNRFNPNPNPDDWVQTSLDAWLACRHEAFFARLGNLLALDEPLGPAFDEGRVYTVYLELGAYFDAHARQVVGAAPAGRRAF